MAVNQASFELDFDDGGDPTFSVRELSEVVNGMFRRAFHDGVWVRGEIEGIQWARTGHVYFTISERTAEGQASLSVACFANTWLRTVRPALSKHRLRLENGLVVRIHGQMNLYAPSGKLSLVMDGLDARFTLGNLAADREQLIRRLLSEGLLDRNRHRPVPDVPLRIGVVTSVGSAAWHDFTHELEASGIGFSLVACDVRVQGIGAGERVAAAIATLADPARRLDVVVVVRGGGSRTDLATFDDERIARAIANCPIPVFTGVGHEIDRAIADEVAHTAFKTPTACAANLVERVRAHALDVEATYARIVHLGLDCLARAQRAVRDRAVSASDRSRRSLGLADQRLVHIGGRVARQATQTLSMETANLRRGGHRISIHGRTRLLSSQRDIAAQASRLARRSVRLPDDATRRVDNLAARVDALDPARALARGWSITHTLDGTLVRDAGALRAGDSLITTLAVGNVTSRVEE
jgi:exodeoxyribonuclease VII large subunit